MGLSLIHASVLGFGTAAASGTVQFYAVGTLTPVITFSDDAGTQPLSGALALGATGAPSTAVYTATPLRAIVKSSAGSTLQDISRIDGDRAELVQVSNSAFTGTDLNTILTAIQSSTGGIDAQFFGTYSSKATTLKQEIEAIGLTPQRFGATGNGVSDDTAAFLLLAAAQTLSGLPVFLPKGTYKISQVITFTAGVVMYGTGRSNGSQIIATNATQDGIIVGINSFLQDFSVGATASTGTAVKLASPSTALNVGFGVGGTGQFATAANNNTGGQSNLAIGCLFNGSTAATAGVWVLGYAHQFTGTGNPIRFAFTTDTSGAAGSGGTADIGNGGSVTVLVTPLSAQYTVVNYFRVRATAAGAGTINVPVAVQQGSAMLAIECFNNGGGAAYVFTFAAPFHSGGTISVNNGLRSVVTFVWNNTDSLWVECSRTALAGGV